MHCACRSDLIRKARDPGDGVSCNTFQISLLFDPLPQPKNADSDRGLLRRSYKLNVTPCDTSGMWRIDRLMRIWLGGTSNILQHLPHIEWSQYGHAGAGFLQPIWTQGLSGSSSGRSRLVGPLRVEAEPPDAWFAAAAACCSRACASRSRFSLSCSVICNLNRLRASCASLSTACCSSVRLGRWRRTSSCCSSDSDSEGTGCGIEHGEGERRLSLRRPP